MLGHTCAHEYTDTCSRATLAHTRHVQRAAHFTSHAIRNVHTCAPAPMQVKELHNENGPWVFVVPRPPSAGMRDDGKRSVLNVLISGEITHEVGAGREVEGQTASVQWQICSQQREKVARRELNHNPVCVFVSRFRHHRLADFCIYRLVWAGLILPVQTLVFTRESKL